MGERVLARFRDLAFARDLRDDRHPPEQETPQLRGSGNALDSRLLVETADPTAAATRADTERTAPRLRERAVRSDEAAVAGPSSDAAPTAADCIPRAVIATRPHRLRDVAATEWFILSQFHKPRRTAAPPCKAPGSPGPVRRSFLRSVLTVGLGVAGGQAAILLASPVLSRIFTPADYGVSGVVIALAAVLSGLSTLRYDFAIITARSTRAEANATALSGLIALGFAAALLAGVAGLAAFWSWGDQAAAGRNAILLLAPAVLLAGTANAEIGHKMLVRIDANRLQASSTMASGLATVAGQISMGLAGFGPWGLVLGRLAGQLAGLALIAVPMMRRILRVLAPKVSRKGMRRIAWAYRRQAFYLAPANTFVVLATQMPIFLLAPAFGAAAAGSYYFANALAMAGLVVYRQTIPNLTLREATRRRLDGKPILPFLARLTAVVAVPALGAALVLHFFSVEIITFVFGDAWLQAAEIMRYTAFFYAMAAIFAVPSAVVTLLGAQLQNLITQIVRVIAVLLAIAIGMRDDDLMQAIVMLTAFDVTIYFVSMLMIFRTARMADRRPLAAGAAPMLRRGGTPAGDA